MKYLKIIAIAFIFYSCDGKPSVPLSETKTINNYRVTKLFEVDSCTVYRFYDGNGTYYFTNCKGSVQWNEHKLIGKINTIEHKQVNTVTNKTE